MAVVAPRGGVTFAPADVRQPVIEAMRRSGLAETIGEEHIHHTIDEAIKTEA